MAEELTVEIRQSRGKHNSRRLRAAGSIPAVLYGHGKETVALSVPAEQLDAAVRHGGRLVTLAGAVDEDAIIRELQWDAWGSHVLHVDFTRVSQHEKLEVDVALELRGEAPGVKEGGLVEQLIHEVHLECEAAAIPDKLDVNINQLGLGESITAGGLELPPSARLLDAPETVIVHCSEPVKELEEEAAAAGEAEPEVIGRKKEEEEGDEEG